MLENAPDLSLMAKARAGFHGPAGTGLNQLFRGMGGAEYVASFVIGFTGEEKEEAGVLLYENAALGDYVAMAPVLYGDDVTYIDGTEATPEQIAQDVAAFLMWAAEPKMMARKQAGFTAVLFLIVLTSVKCKGAALDRHRPPFVSCASSGWVVPQIGAQLCWRIRKERLGRSWRMHSPALYQQGLSRNAPRILRVVRDEKQGRALLRADRRDPVQHLRPERRAERSERFVEQEKRLRAKERAACRSRRDRPPPARPRPRRAGVGRAADLGAAQARRSPPR